MGVLKLVILVKEAESSKSHCHCQDRLSLTRDVNVAFPPGIDYSITSYLLVGQKHTDIGLCNYQVGQTGTLLSFRRQTGTLDLNLRQG